MSRYLDSEKVALRKKELKERYNDEFAEVFETVVICDHDLLAGTIYAMLSKIREHEPGYVNLLFKSKTKPWKPKLCAL